MIVMERAEPEQPAAFPSGGGSKQRGSHGGQVDAILDGGPVETVSHGREITPSEGFGQSRVLTVPVRSETSPPWGFEVSDLGPARGQKQSETRLLTVSDPGLIRCQIWGLVESSTTNRPCRPPHGPAPMLARGGIMACHPCQSMLEWWQASTLGICRRGCPVSESSRRIASVRPTGWSRRGAQPGRRCEASARCWRATFDRGGNPLGVGRPGPRAGGRSYRPAGQGQGRPRRA
jgi:hypothetical protein